MLEVSWSTNPVTAEAGVDYEAPAGGRLRWENRDARPQTIVIDLLQNEATETVKSFQVQLAAAEGGLLSEIHTVDVGIGGVPTVDDSVVEEATAVDVAANGVLRLDLAGEFSDPQGRPLTYDVAADDPEVAEVSVNADGAVAVRGLVAGQVSVTVTALGGRGRRRLSGVKELCRDGPRACPGSEIPLGRGYKTAGVRAHRQPCFDGGRGAHRRH